MICSLPVALAFSTTGFMSHGAKNWPFLMLTGLPAEHTLRMKSVWRTRNAGVCSTSTTEATSSIGVYSWTSVSTGTPICFLTSPRTFRPSSMPGPRNAVPEVRLALSKLDLKMKLTPSLSVISFSLPAVSSCSCIDSITQGPAIRNRGWSSPTSNPHSFMAFPCCPRHRPGRCAGGLSMQDGGRSPHSQVRRALRKAACRPPCAHARHG